MLTDQYISDMSPHNGSFKARFCYVFDSGVVNIGPLSVASQSDADVKLIANSERAKDIKARQDASEAASMGLLSAHKEATTEQVQFAVLDLAYSAETLHESYDGMKNLAPQLLALGLTDDQYAITFNATVEQVQNIKNKWSYLSANSAAIEAYAQIESGWNQ